MYVVAMSTICPSTSRMRVSSATISAFPWASGVKSLGWVLLLWTVVFWRLGYLPLLDPDEAHYAEITREMMSAREFVVPLLNGEPHIDKPVLFHWLQAGSFRILGQTEFAARLPSALSAMVLFLITYWCGARLFRRDTGEHGALLLATIPATFALSYVGVFDMLFTVCLFGALTALCVSVVERRPALEYLAFLLVAGAVLTKGPVAMVLLTVTALLCLLHPVARAATLRLRWGRGIAIVLAVAAPWFFLMWYKFGPQFIDQYVLYNNVSLFGAAALSHQSIPAVLRPRLPHRLPAVEPDPAGPYRRPHQRPDPPSRRAVRRVRAGRLGGDGDRVLQPVVVQARHLHLSGRPGGVPARGERLAAGARRGARERVGAADAGADTDCHGARRRRRLDLPVQAEPADSRSTRSCCRSR